MIDKMKFVVFILLFVNSLIADENKIRLGILYNKIFTSEKDEKINSKVWEIYLKEEKLFENVITNFYEKDELILEDFMNDKLDVIVVNPALYFKNKIKLDFEIKNIWASSLSKEVFQEYYLIRNKKSNVTFDNLNNFSLYYRDKSSKEWIESSMIKEKKRSLDRVFNEVVNVDNYSKLIYRVFLKTDSLIVIPKDEFETLSKLNPQVLKQTEIIKSSEAIFFAGIGLTNKNISDNKMQIINSMLEKDENSIEVLNMVNLNKIYVKRDFDLNLINRFYNNYFSLLEEIK